jgi:general stress protein 26
VTDDRDADQLWKLIEKIGLCVLGMHSGQDIRAQPVAANIDRDEHTMCFLIDAHSHENENVEHDLQVGLDVRPWRQEFLSRDRERRPLR